MAINFLNNVSVVETAASSDTDKFVVLDSGVLKYRTGAQVRSDIGAGTGNGTVTSVTVSGGTGLSGSGTVTTSGTITLTNSDRGSSQNIFKNVASDSGTAVADNNNDTLTIAGGTNVSTAVVGDTLTITATDTNTQYTAGTGLTLSGTVFNTNVDGTQSVAANTSTTTAARTYKVQVDSSDNLVVNVPWTSGSGGIAGSLADDQVAFGNGTNTIDGSDDFAWNGNTLTLGGSTGTGNLSAVFVTGDGMTSNTSINLGTVIQHQGDTNTKFGFPSNDTFTIETNGSERMRIASTGAVQLNTYGSGTFTGTAAYGLSVDSNGNIIETSSGGGIGGSISNTQVAFGNSSSEITGDVDFNFNVSTNTLRIGVDNDYTGGIVAMAMNADSMTTLDITLGSVNGFTPSWITQNRNPFNSQTKFGFAGSDTIAFNTAASERLRITSSGNVGIGTTSPAYDLEVDGMIAATTSTANSASKGFAMKNGSYGTNKINSYYGAWVSSVSIYVGGYLGYSYQPIAASAFNVNSDYRLKSNVGPLENAISRLNQLEVHRFNWNDKLDDPKVDGFIAHEVKEIVPEAVTGEKDELWPDGNPKYQGIDQAKLVPLLTAALKEAITKIETLETRIQTLENN